jgi:hypothetical protein
MQWRLQFNQIDEATLKCIPQQLLESETVDGSAVERSLVETEKD